MSKTKKEITLPKQLQIEMMRFFLKTSIPRKKKQQMNSLSDNNDRSGS
jgi:hypothetical protein